MSSTPPSTMGASSARMSTKSSRRQAAFGVVWSRRSVTVVFAATVNDVGQSVSSGLIVREETLPRSVVPPPAVTRARTDGTSPAMPKKSMPMVDTFHLATLPLR